MQKRKAENRERWRTMVANLQPKDVDASSPFYSLLVAGEIQQATAPDEDGDTPLHIAVSQCEVNMVHQLLYLISMAGQSVDPINNLHQTPLHLAIITKQPDLVGDLIQAGADPNICDRHGNTSMHLACIHKCAPIMYVLLQSSCTPQLNVKNFEGYIPLHLAVIHGDAEIVRMLVRSTPNYIDCKDTKNGWTALFHATARDVEEIIEILLIAGPDINCQSYSGNTALHIASGRGYTEIVRRLMQSGADMSMRNSHRESAAMITTNKVISNLLHGKDYRPRSPTSTSRPSVNIRPPAQPKVTSQSQRSGWPLTIISPSEKVFNPFTKQNSSVTTKSSSNSHSAVATHILTPPNTQIVLKPAKSVSSSVAPSTSHISQDQIAHLLRAPPKPQSSSKPIQQSPVMGYTEYATASKETISAVVSQVTSALKASKSIPVTVLLKEPHGPLELLNAVGHTAAAILSKSNSKFFPVISKKNEHEMEKNCVEIQSTNIVSQDADKPGSVNSSDPSEEPTAKKAICNTDGDLESPESKANEKILSIPTSATEDLSGASKMEANSALLKELVNEEIISKVDCKEGNHADGLLTEVDNLDKLDEIKSEETQEIDSKTSLNITEKNSEIYRDNLDHSDMLCKSEEPSKVETSAFKAEASNIYSETKNSTVEQNNEKSISSCLSDSKSNSVTDISSLEKDEEKDCKKISKNEVDCLQPDTRLETEEKNNDGIDKVISDKTENVMTPDEKLSSCKEKVVVPSGGHRSEIENHCTSFVIDVKEDIVIHKTDLEPNTIDLESSKLNKGVQYENVSDITSPIENEEMSGNVSSRHQEIQEKLRKHITSKTKILLPVESEETGQIAGGSGNLTPDEHFPQFCDKKVSIAEKSTVNTDETDKVVYDVDKCDISNEVQKSCVEDTSKEKEGFCNPVLQTEVEDSVLSSDIPIQLSDNSNEQRSEDACPTNKDHCVPEQSLADETQIAECLDEQVSTNEKQTLSDDLKNTSSLNPVDIQAVSLDVDDDVVLHEGEKSVSNETVPSEREGITQTLIPKQNEIDDVSKSGTVSNLQCGRQDLPSSECISADGEISVNACSDASSIDNVDGLKQSTSLNFGVIPEIVVTQQEVDVESTNPCDTTNNMDISSSSETTTIGLGAHDDQQVSTTIVSVKTSEDSTPNCDRISETNNAVLELSNEGSPKLLDTTERGESSYSKDNVANETRKRKSPSGRENYICAEEINKKQKTGKDPLSEEQAVSSISKQGNTKKDLIIPKKRKIPVEYRTDFDKSMEDSLSKSGTDNLIKTAVDTVSIGTLVSKVMQGDDQVEDVRPSYKTTEYTSDENRLDVRETPNIATSMTTNSTSQPQSTLSTAQALLSLGDPQPQLLTALKLKQTEECRQQRDSISPKLDYSRTVVASSNPAKDANLDFPASTSSLEVNPGDRSSSSLTNRAGPLEATDTENRRVSVIVYPQETKKRPKSTSSFEHEIPTKHAHLDVPISRASSTSPRLTIASTVQESIKPQSLTYRQQRIRQDNVHSTRRGPREDVYYKGALSVPGSDSVNLSSMRSGNNPFMLSDVSKKVPRTSFVTPTSFVYSHSLHPSYKVTDAVPRVGSQVPNIVSRDAHIVSQVPHMVSQVTQVPHAVGQGHHFVTNGPHIVAQVPNVIPQGSHVVSQFPPHPDSTRPLILSNPPLSTTVTHSSNVLPHIALNVPHQLGSIPNPSQLIHHVYPPQGQHHVHKGATPTFIITDPPTHQPGAVLIQQPYQVVPNSSTIHGSKYTPPLQPIRGFPPMIVREPMRRGGEFPVFKNTHVISNTPSQAQPMPGPRAYNPYSKQVQMQSIQLSRLYNTTLQTSDPDQPIDLSCKKKPEEPLDMSISSISRQTSADASCIAHASQGASSSLVHPPLRPTPETSTPMAYMLLQKSAQVVNQSQRSQPYSIRTVYDEYESDEPQLFIDETATAGDVRKRSRTLKKGGKGRHSRLEQKK
ncbi:ankyrin repeat domain-containing protein 36C-like isoform X2 [Anneissia japonica]|uniref:ankyrin repeat domain-containing protein 36C-like isoform X2 n=1 Tax=Anneissia japonica TaxID=1529436 RepID=UPI001425865D|nr:ankyrin repeat domain-containing protein 36C-like isoform X2 [Anneissia japonica]